LITRNEVVCVFLSSVLSAAAAVAVEEYRRPVPPIPHDGPADPRFVSVGRAYTRELAKAYSGAIRVGVTELEAGVPVSQVFLDVGKTWDQRRKTAFDRLITPELSKVLPESAKDSDISPDQRTHLAAALRGLAQGVAP
jgi:hypothetical protein